VAAELGVAGGEAGAPARQRPAERRGTAAEQREDVEKRQREDVEKRQREDLERRQHEDVEKRQREDVEKRQREDVETRRGEDAPEARHRLAPAGPLAETRSPDSEPARFGVGTIAPPRAPLPASIPAAPQGHLI